MRIRVNSVARIAWDEGQKVDTSRKKLGYFLHEDEGHAIAW